MAFNQNIFNYLDENSILKKTVEKSIEDGDCLPTFIMAILNQWIPTKYLNMNKLWNEGSAP